MIPTIGNKKTFALRRADDCAHCGAALEVGTRAVWCADSRTVCCLPCADAAPAQQTSPESQAGASAQREYERRSARELAKKQKAVAEDQAWREQIKQERPVLGRLAALVTDKPTITPESQSTTAWKIGAEGERRVGDRLDELDGVFALHDLAVPNSRANIDHLAVAPTGVYVIDAKKYKGEIESRNVGSFFKPDDRLYVGGRDRSKLVDAVLWQAEVVRKVLPAELCDVPIHAALCFVDGDFGLIPVYCTVDLVSVVGLRKLSKMLRSPGSLSDAERSDVAGVLRNQLHTADGSGRKSA